MIYYLYRLAGFLVPLVPLRLGYWVVARLGGLFYRLSLEARANVRDNVTHVLGEDASAAEVERVTRETFRYIALNYYDLLRVPALTPAEIERVVRVEGWERIEEALSRGRGLIVVTAHFGLFELMPVYFIQNGTPGHVIGRQPGDEALENLVVNMRSSMEVPTVFQRHTRAPGSALTCRV